KTVAEAGATAATAPYEAVLGAAPPTAAIGREVHRLAQTGGAKLNRDALGQAVDRAAQTGPDVDLTGLKAEAQRILEKEIRPPQTAFPRRPPEAAEAELTERAGVGAEQLAKLHARASAGDTRAAASLEEIQAALGSAQSAAQTETPKHPAMAVIGRILNAEDRVPFADA